MLNGMAILFTIGAIGLLIGMLIVSLIIGRSVRKKRERVSNAKISSARLSIDENFFVYGKKD